MNIIKDLYGQIAGKKVEIFVKPYGTGSKEAFKGTVIGFYNTGAPFIALDTNELINVKYIEIIKIIG